MVEFEFQINSFTYIFTVPLVKTIVPFSFDGIVWADNIDITKEIIILS